MLALLFWLSVGAIIYHYFGYPLMLAVVARLRLIYRPSSLNRDEPTVTLLIAAYNEAAVIERKLENSCGLDYPPDRLQILVAADGSDDATPEIVRQFDDARVELSYEPVRGGKMAAINRAMPLARGEFIVFSDANNMYDPQAIRKLIAPFADARVGGATGAKRIAKDDRNLSSSEGLYWKYESFIKKQETRLGCVIGAPGEIFAIRRDLFDLPPDNIINDDFYMAMSIINGGYNVVYIPDAVSYESASATAGDEMTRRARIVAGRFQFMFEAAHLLPVRRPLVMWQLVSHKFLRPLVPIFMIVAFTANLLLVLLSPSFPPASWGRLVPSYDVIALALQSVFYATAIAGNQVNASGKIGKLLYIPTFFVNSNLAALVGLYRYLRGQQSHVWQRVRRYDE